MKMYGIISNSSTTSTEKQALAQASFLSQLHIFVVFVCLKFLQFLYLNFVVLTNQFLFGRLVFLNYLFLLVFLGFLPFFLVFLVFLPTPCFLDNSFKQDSVIVFISFTFSPIKETALLVLLFFI